VGILPVPKWAAVERAQRERGQRERGQRERGQRELGQRELALRELALRELALRDRFRRACSRRASKERPAASSEKLAAGCTQAACRPRKMQDQTPVVRRMLERTPWARKNTQEEQMQGLKPKRILVALTPTKTDPLHHHYRHCLHTGLQ
jgi:hypothetical protein